MSRYGFENPFWAASTYWDDHAFPQRDNAIPDSRFRDDRTYLADLAVTLNARVSRCTGRWLIEQEITEITEGSSLLEILDHLIATGFASHVQDITDHAQYGRKEWVEVLTQVMDTFSSGVLGVTMACAQCHDHKYEPIPQRDYYRLMRI